MKQKTFAQIDSNFKWTILENTEFFYWNDEDETIKFDKIKFDALVLSKKYSEAHKSLELHYPAYYVKGKNWAYYNSICMVTSLTPNEDYAYYQGVYIDIRTNDFTIIDSWNALEKDSYSYTNIIKNLSEEERKFLWIEL